MLGRVVLMFVLEGVRPSGIPEWVSPVAPLLPRPRSGPGTGPPAALRAELERVKAMEKIDADGYQRVKLYDGKREHDIAFRGRKIGSSQKADAWLTPKGTIAVYDHREQELYTYDEYDAFADDEGVDGRLRAEVADALGAKYVEELDI